MTIDGLRSAVEVPPEAPAWDPLTTPYVSWACRSAQHDECRGGMDYYPLGLAGEKIDISCACVLAACRCSTGGRSS